MRDKMTLPIHVDHSQVHNDCRGLAISNPCPEFLQDQMFIAISREPRRAFVPLHSSVGDSYHQDFHQQYTVIVMPLHTTRASVVFARRPASKAGGSGGSGSEIPMRCDEALWSPLMDQLNHE